MLVALSGDDAGNLFGGPEGFSEDEKKAVEKLVMRVQKRIDAKKTFKLSKVGSTKGQNNKKSVISPVSELKRAQ